MNVELTVKISRLGYPGIYRTRFDVLHHLFCVIGNGYEWRGGEIVEMCEDASTVAAMEIVLCRHKHPMPFDSIDAEIKAGRKAAKAHDDDFLSVFDRNPKMYGWYPLSEYALLVNVPENVRPDWKREAVRIARILASADGTWLGQYTAQNKRWAKKALKSMGVKPRRAKKRKK